MFPNNFLVRNNKTYANYEEVLPANSKLLLYTDGLIEARSKNNDNLYFEYSNMNDIFIRNSRYSSEIFINNLFNGLVEFRGSDSFEDDVCLICIDIK